MLDLKGYGWMLWDGVQITLAVAVCSMGLALILGLFGAWGKLSQSKAAHGARAGRSDGTEDNCRHVILLQGAANFLNIRLHFTRRCRPHERVVIIRNRSNHPFFC